MYLASHFARGQVSKASRFRDIQVRGYSTWVGRARMKPEGLRVVVATFPSRLVRISYRYRGGLCMSALHSSRDECWYNNNGVCASMFGTERPT
jgi:hypothetical protein